MPLITEITNVLKKDIDALIAKQAYHLKVKKRYVTYMVIFAFGFFFYIFLASFGSELPFELLKVISMMLLFVGVNLMGWFYNKNKKAFITYYKNIFFPKVLKQVHPTYSYVSKDKVMSKLFNKALGRKFSIFKVSGEDVITGKTKEGWSFSVSELYRSNKSKQVAYTYLLYTIKLPYRFDGSFF